ncbi:MAG: hypothetical protein SOS93_04415 [Mannheimia varigena]|nr:hypothetical protein [Mannheimia varigena]
MWFEVYLDNENKWRWRLCRYFSDGRLDVIATSHQGYTDKSICNIDINNVKLTNLSTPIRYI